MSDSEKVKQHYQDGPDHPQEAVQRKWMDCTLDEWIAGEQAYRDGYRDGVENTKLWDVWASREEIDAAWEARRQARQDAERPVYYDDEFYEDGSPIPKEIFYTSSHRVPAAYARGMVHAMEFFDQDYDRFLDLKTSNFDDESECDRKWNSVRKRWYRRVERWLEEGVSTDKLVLPPRPLLNEDLPEESQPTPSLLTRVDQIELCSPDWLIRGILERDSLALIFGDSGCGKSFTAIDWAARIATGTPWRGHAVKAAPVIYVAGEGHQGFARRTRAWEIHNGVSLAKFDFCFVVHGFYLSVLVSNNCRAHHGFTLTVSHQLPRTSSQLLAELAAFCKIPPVAFFMRYKTNSA